MLEETNQAQAEVVSTNELEFSSTDFSEAELKSGDSEVATSESTESEPTKEGKQQSQASEEKFTVKYNGKEVELTKAELITNAQKGMNYDHVLQERDSLKNSDEMKALESIAKESGLKDVKTLIETLKTNLADIKLTERAKALEAEGMTPEHALKMAELELKADAKKTAEPEPKDDTIEKLTDEFRSLHDEFPETNEWKKLSDFPEEMQTLLNEGKSPLIAYTKYVQKKAEDEARIAKQNATAKDRDTGSFKSGKSEEKQDDFMSGFNS